MIYTLVGAPGSGKQEVARKLNDHLNIGITSDPFSRGDLALDQLADYRTEIWLAANRAIQQEDGIYLHSLVDNVAYCSSRLSSMAVYGGTDEDALERWYLVLSLLARMLQDSFESDRTLYLPNNDEEFKNLDVALLVALDEFGIPFTKIDPEGEVEVWCGN